MQFFSILYSWLVGWYGTALDDFLTSTDEGMNYILIGSATIFISFVLGLLYYKIIDKPKWAHWYCWLITLVINGIINFWWSWQVLLQNLYDGDMDVQDEQTGKMVTYVTDGNCLMFGVANMIMATLIFIVLSFFIFRFISTNCKYSPLCK
ncbi:MAG: hypothetical protein VZR53_08760 [Prevotella sp.]|nr:hypothetical protein [Prevotella sp.]